MRFETFRRVMNIVVCLCFTSAVSAAPSRLAAEIGTSAISNDGATTPSTVEIVFKGKRVPFGMTIRSEMLPDTFHYTHEVVDVTDGRMASMMNVSPNQQLLTLNDMDTTKLNHKELMALFGAVDAFHNSSSSNHLNAMIEMVLKTCTKGGMSEDMDVVPGKCHTMVYLNTAAIVEEDFFGSPQIKPFFQQKMESYMSVMSKRVTKMCRFDGIMGHCTGTREDVCDNDVELIWPCFHEVRLRSYGDQYYLCYHGTELTMCKDESRQIVQLTKTLHKGEGRMRMVFAVNKTMDTNDDIDGMYYIESDGKKMTLKQHADISTALRFDSIPQYANHTTYLLRVPGDGRSTTQLYVQSDMIGGDVAAVPLSQWPRDMLAKYAFNLFCHMDHTGHGHMWHRLGKTFTAFTGDVWMYFIKICKAFYEDL